MTPYLGIGMALLAVAAYHLIPAALTGEIPTTSARRVSRDANPTEFWMACLVFAVAAALGFGMVLGTALRAVWGNS
jgi:hypothetical protein